MCICSTEVFSVRDCLRTKNESRLTVDTEEATGDEAICGRDIFRYSDRAF